MIPFVDRPLVLDGAIRTSRRKKEAKSPQQQRDMMHATAETYGHEIRKIHDSGRNESGKTMDRETLRVVMERVERGEIDGLIMALADRLGRAPIEEAMTYVRQLTGVGVLVLADMGGMPLDLSNAMTETNLVIQLQMARQYWLMTANRTLLSKTNAIAAGKYVGPTPLGYVRRGGFLFPDETLGPVMTRAFELAAKPEGLHDAVDLLREHVPERNWTTDHVRRVLRSKAYLGWSKSGDLINKQAQLPLTDLKTWTAAQSTPRHRRTPRDYVLSKVISCGRCGAPMTGQLATVPHAKRDGKKWTVDLSKPKRSYRRYTCSANCKGGCSISAPLVEGYVRETMRTFAEGFVLRDTPVIDLDDYEAQWRRAEMLRDTFADDVERQDAMGRTAAMRTAAAYEAKVMAAKAEFDAAVKLHSADSETMPAPDQLDDDAQLLRAIRVGVSSIVVRPGRGSVDDRVVIDFKHGDDVARALAS